MHGRGVLREKVKWHQREEGGYTVMNSWECNRQLNLPSIGPSQIAPRHAFPTSRSRRAPLKASLAAPLVPKFEPGKSFISNMRRSFVDVLLHPFTCIMSFCIFSCLSHNVSLRIPIEDPDMWKCRVRCKSLKGVNMRDERVRRRYFVSP